MPPQTPTALLLEELVEEVLLHLPPDDPVGLVRAALVCKSWCTIISGPGFRRQFREFHRAPPMLGFFMNLDTISRFVRTSSPCPPFAHHSNCKVIDTRHGRILLYSAPMDWEKVQNPLKRRFIVWDPITDHWRELPLLPGSMSPDILNAAVLCAASLGGTCNHFDCHRGHFLVVLVGTSNLKMLAYVYSSETGTWTWSKPISLQSTYYSVASVPSALVGNVLYFSCWNCRNFLRYDLGTQEMSVIQLPVNYFFGNIVPMTMDGSGLGFATLVNSRLHLWDASDDRGAGWSESRSIELESFLPARCDPTSLYVIGYADSIGLVFLNADVGIVAFDLNFSRVTKVWKERCYGHGGIFPYLSFYTPAFGASTGEEPRCIPSA